MTCVPVADLDLHGALLLGRYPTKISARPTSFPAATNRAAVPAKGEEEWRDTTWSRCCESR